MRDCCTAVRRLGCNVRCLLSAGMVRSVPSVKTVVFGFARAGRCCCFDMAERCDMGTRFISHWHRRSEVPECL